MSDQQPPAQPYGQPAQPYPPHAQPAQPYPPRAQPGQPYGQPPQPYPPYGQAPAYGAPGDVTARPAGDGLGRVAFIIAVIAVAINGLVTLMGPWLYSADDFTLPGLVNTTAMWVTFAADLAALIIGLIALRRPGSRVFAAIAVGAAGSAIVGTLAYWVSMVFYWIG